MINRPKGTYDIFGEDAFYWHYFEEAAHESARVFGFTELRTPIFERTELFVRSVGDETDIVQKEMYTFLDKGNRSISLRPEGTAAVIRAYVENSIASQGLPQKFYYMGPMFRYERPQAGRTRQFEQFGAEIIGADSPAADVEAIWLSLFLLEKLRLNNYELHINYLGNAQDRENYKKALKEYYAPYLENLCSDCKKRFEKNILRLLDCKIDIELKKNAPKITDYLSEESARHFESVKSQLERLRIPYTHNTNLVRGLDYYTGTVFEVKHPFKNTVFDVLGGGRYDDVVKELGGKQTSAVGFACGIGRIIEIMKAENIDFDFKPVSEVYILSMGEEAVEESEKIASFLRQRGISVERDLMSRNMKAQLKYASKCGSKFVIIIGEDELEKEVYIVKDMETGIQTSVDSSWIENYILDKLDE